MYINEVRIHVKYLSKITSPWEGEENYSNLIGSLENFPFPVLSCVGDDTGLYVYRCVCVCVSL